MPYQIVRLGLDTNLQKRKKEYRIGSQIVTDVRKMSKDVIFPVQFLSSTKFAISVAFLQLAKNLKNANKIPRNSQQGTSKQHKETTLELPRHCQGIAKEFSRNF